MSEKQQQRRQSRILALKSLFYFIGRDQEKTIKNCFDEVYENFEFQEETIKEFAWNMAQCGVENFAKIKVIIHTLAPEFAFNKIVAINRTLLILGIVEIKFIKTPPVVVINEYVELAKVFGEEKSPSLINGVLDNYRKNLNLDRS